MTQTLLHGLTIICDFDLLKRKRFADNAQSPRNSTKRKYFESLTTSNQRGLATFQRAPPTVLLRRSVLRSLLFRLPQRRDCANQLCSPCVANLHKLVIFNTTTALLAYFSRKRTRATSNPSLFLQRLAQCICGDAH